VIFATPIRLDSGDDALSAAGPQRQTPVTWALVAVIVAWFVIERLAVARIRGGWPVMPMDASVAILAWSADAKLYADFTLFAPRQLWTQALFHAGWWQLIANLVFLLPFARALERFLGAGLFAMALALLAPISILPHLALASPAAHPHEAILGASGLVAGTVAMALAAFPRTPTSCVAGYWLIVLIGYVRFRLATRWLLAAYLLQEWLRIRAQGSPLAVDILVSGAISGWVLGHSARLAKRWRGD
jgi:membrane associated rhomboid family serine protease